MSFATMNNALRAEHRAAPKPARCASRKAGVPSGDRPAYSPGEGLT